MRRRVLLVLLVGPALASACALVAGLGDRTLAEADAGAEADGPFTADAPAEGTTEPEEDGGPVPAYCEGIVLYASFDRGLTGERAGGSVQVLGGVKHVAEGKYGGAASLVRDESTTAKASQGAVLYFVASDAGPVWSENEGSLAVWYKAEPGGNPQIPVLYRPVATLPPATVKTSGLAFYLKNNGASNKPVFGLHAATEGVLVFDVGALVPYLRSGEYNHYFTSWKKGGSPSAALAVNGGLGLRFSDGGAGDADAGSDAGAPYRATTDRAWTSEGAPIALRIGGASANSPEGAIDDLVVWDRVLGLEEMATVYGAGAAIGQRCRIR